MDRRLKHLLVRYPVLGRLGRSVKYRVSSRVRPCSMEDPTLHDADPVLLDTGLLAKIPLVGIVKDQDPLPYYTKYERFCQANRLPYRFVDIHSSRWMEEIRDCDCLVWRPMECPWDLSELKRKFFFISEKVNIPTFPSFRDAMIYGDKDLQSKFLQHRGFPFPKTFMTHDFQEAMEWAETAHFPQVHKIFPSSSSQGVAVIADKKKARSLIKKAFGPGLRTCWPGTSLKNSLFFQEFIPHTGFDLRITVADDDHIFGYYRIPPKRDFRASGLSPTIKMSLPAEPIHIARALKKELDSVILSVDFLQSARDKKFYVTEVSPLIKVITCEQLHVNGQPGRYSYDPVTKKLTFHKGRFWLQELSLRNFLLKNFMKEQT